MTAIHTILRRLFVTQQPLFAPEPADMNVRLMDSDLIWTAFTLTRKQTRPKRGGAVISKRSSARTCNELSPGLSPETALEWKA